MGSILRTGALASGGGGGFSINFDGVYERDDILSGSRVYRLYTFLSSGALRVRGHVVGDVWLCGGGGGGRHGAYVEGNATASYSGGGGGGGHSAYAEGMRIVSGGVVIGQGGAPVASDWDGGEGGASRFLALTAAGTSRSYVLALYGRPGGSGGGAGRAQGSSVTLAGSGDGGQYTPFGDSANFPQLHCAGGAGGNLPYWLGGVGGTGGGAGGLPTSGSGAGLAAGGAHGGGHGGYYIGGDAQKGGNGSCFGAGGGGGTMLSLGGHGHPGVAYLRIAMDYTSEHPNEM